MRVLILALLIAATPLAASAQTLTPVPAGMAAREQALLPKLTPRARAFVTRQGRIEADRPNPQGLRNTVSQALGPDDFKAADIDTLIFLVMMEANRDAEAELRAIAEEMRKANELKRTQRDLKQKMQEPAAGRPVAAPANGLRKGPGPLPAAAPCPGRNCPASQDTLDTQSDLTEGLQLRMQRATDRRKQALETASNLMKKFSETSSTIVGNAK